MGDIMNSEKPILLVDIDDLLVRSSGVLQDIVNKNTNFKTEVLKMMEQLKRNCKYFCRCCNLNEEDADFLKAADTILNQFLEERDVFLETDNLPKGKMRPCSVKELGKIVELFDLIKKHEEFFHGVNTFCAQEAERLINEAKTFNRGDLLTIPNYGALVKMDTNDIIKNNSVTNDSKDIAYRKYVLYDKPLFDIKNCINLEDKLFDIITNAKVFCTPSNEIVDYTKIHSEENVNWDAIRLINELIDSGKFAGVYFSTHHNGGREEDAKIALMQRVLPRVDGFIGQRFHDTEHEGDRRSRSSKIEYAAEYLGVSPSRIILIDDSAANCKDCKEKGGTEILYKPQTDSEIINGKLEETGFNRILSFDDKRIYEYIDMACEKQKTYRKI